MKVEINSLKIRLPNLMKSMLSKKKFKWVFNCGK